MAMEIGGASLEMELDTGATYNRLWRKQPPPMKPSQLKLRTYTGEPLKACGEVTVVVRHHDQAVELPLSVFPGNGASLLGRNWMEKLRLDWQTVHQLHSLKKPTDPFAWFPELFNDDLGTMKDVKASIHVKPNTNQVFCKARMVPYLMKTKVDDELDRLQSANIIEPVTYSQWAAPIVSILKSDGTVRICGDYKVTINWFAHVEQCALPTPEDLFATLAGGVMFSKLDMAHAYQQILIDDDSKHYLTINTHRGLFVSSRLAFGVSSAPPIFQQVIKNLLAGVPQTVVYLDDILVTGASEEEHKATPKEVLRRLAEAGLPL